MKEYVYWNKVKEPIFYEISGENSASQPLPESSDSRTKSIPGSTLKCLDDPSFEFEGNSIPTDNDICASQQPPAKKPAYRVLEGIPYNKSMLVGFGYTIK